MAAREPEVATGGGRRLSRGEARAPELHQEVLEVLHAREAAADRAVLVLRGLGAVRDVVEARDRDL